MLIKEISVEVEAYLIGGGFGLSIFFNDLISFQCGFMKLGIGTQYFLRIFSMSFTSDSETSGLQ